MKYKHTLIIVSILFALVPIAQAQAFSQNPTDYLFWDSADQVWDGTTLFSPSNGDPLTTTGYITSSQQTMTYSANRDALGSLSLQQTSDSEQGNRFDFNSLTGVTVQYKFYDDASDTSCAQIFYTGLGSGVLQWGIGTWNNPNSYYYHDGSDHWFGTRSTGWHTVEVEINQDGTQTSVWQDGTLIVESAGKVGPLTKIQMHNSNSASGGFYCQQNAFDDIKIWTGSREDQPTDPNAPLTSEFKPNAEQGKDSSISNSANRQDTNNGAYAYPAVGYEDQDMRWLMDWSYVAQSYTEPVLVSSCALDVYLHSDTTAEENVKLHKVKAAWDEDTVTWNNFGSLPGGQEGVDYDHTQNIIVGYTGTFVAGNRVQWTLDNQYCTDLINGNLGDYNQGLLMMNPAAETGGTNQRHFFRSSDHTDGPILIIETISASAQQPTDPQQPSSTSDEQASWLDNAIVYQSYDVDITSDESSNEFTATLGCDGSCPSRDDNEFMVGSGSVHFNGKDNDKISFESQWSNYHEPIWNYTMAAWVKLRPSDQPSYFMGTHSENPARDHDDYIILQYNDKTGHTDRYKIGAISSEKNSGSSVVALKHFDDRLNKDAWFHICYTADHTDNELTAKVYINGSLAAQESGSWNPNGQHFGTSPPTDGLTIGNTPISSSQGWNLALNGRLDEVIVTNHVARAQDCAWAFEQGVAGLRLDAPPIEQPPEEPAPNPLSELDGRHAIEQVALSIVTDATVQNDRHLYLRNTAGDQFYGVFDKVIKAAGKVWAFNFISEDESATQAFNLTPMVYVVDIQGTQQDVEQTVTNVITQTQ